MVIRRRRLFFVWVGEGGRMNSKRGMRKKKRDDKVTRRLFVCFLEQGGRGWEIAIECWFCM